MLGVAKIVKDAKDFNGTRRMLGMPKILREHTAWGNSRVLIYYIPPQIFLCKLGGTYYCLILRAGR